MAMASAHFSCRKPRFHYRIECRKKERNRDRDIHPFIVVDVTPPTKNLGIRSFPNNIHCGESITIEGQTYTVKGVTHRYQLRKGKYEPSEKRLDMKADVIGAHHSSLPISGVAALFIGTFGIMRKRTK